MLDKIIELLTFQIKAPTSYGWYHIICLILVVITTSIFVIFFRKVNDKSFRLIILICYIIIMLLEVYKEFVIGFDKNTRTYTYQWWAFPFQFCSSPFYVLPFLFLLKDGKLRDCAISFLSTFSLFAGICVYIYPNSVFTKTLGIDIQTMVHHGLQVVLGIYCAVYNKQKYSIRYYLGGVIFFVGFIFIATVLNEVYYIIEPNKTFNMFFISRHYISELPILSTIQEKTPYIVFYLVYFLGFNLCAFIMHIICSLINKTNPFKIKTDYKKAN